jgi:hypothetical protein
MLYVYDKENLDFSQVKIKSLLKWILIIVIFSMIGGYSISTVVGKTKVVDVGINEHQIMELGLPKPIKTLTKTKINRVLLANYLKKRVKFPEIVMAQVLHESARFKSSIFFENHNLFGMKEAHSRQTTSTGTNRGHATYDSWQDSVNDYALYQASFLRGVKTESQYLAYLNEHYAEDIKYDIKIKKLLTETKPFFNK